MHSGRDDDDDGDVAPNDTLHMSIRALTFVHWSVVVVAEVIGGGGGGGISSIDERDCVWWW